ncbi:MAG: hypothetical protein JWQ95_6609 [Sphaerisporangium sp.]|nr:hypothetical protein [Sphaerisporangium sp.]
MPQGCIQSCGVVRWPLAETAGASPARCARTPRSRLRPKGCLVTTDRHPKSVGRRSPGPLQSRRFVPTLPFPCKQKVLSSKRSHRSFHATWSRRNGSTTSDLAAPPHLPERPQSPHRCSAAAADLPDAAASQAQRRTQGVRRAGVEETKAELATEKSEDASAALDYLLAGEIAGDFVDFSVETASRWYFRYYLRLNIPTAPGNR